MNRQPLLNSNDCVRVMRQATEPDGVRRLLLSFDAGPPLSAEQCWAAAAAAAAGAEPGAPACEGRQVAIDPPRPDGLSDTGFVLVRSDDEWEVPDSIVEHLVGGYALPDLVSMLRRDDALAAVCWPRKTAEFFASRGFDNAEALATLEAADLGELVVGLNELRFSVSEFQAGKPKPCVENLVYLVEKCRKYVTDAADRRFGPLPGEPPPSYLQVLQDREFNIERLTFL